MTPEKLIEKYCLKENLETYDPYDIWKTKLGFFVKNGFNKNRTLFIIPAAIFTITDIFINNKFRLFYKKQEYPVVRAFAALSLINLYKKYKKQEYIKYAKKHIDWLINNYSKGYNGYCWGIDFKLPISKNIIYPENTPYSTNTPYILEALIEYNRINKSNKIKNIIKSVFDFLEKDLQIMYEDNNLLATSYGPLKDRIVTNSISYTMYSYALLIEFLPKKKEYIINKINKLFNFITKYQQENGSWLYAPLDSNSFIDCFHSAFVIKNIIKTSKISHLENSELVVNNGYTFIKTNFYTKKTGMFNRFVLSNKPNISKYDLYDNAEMLNLAQLMNDKDLINDLIKKINYNFVTSKGVYSVIDLFGIKRNKNTLRWAVMPYIYSISKI